MRFWHDPWLNGAPLKLQFPILFYICQVQDCTVKEFVDVDCNISFGRRLHSDLLDQWNALVVHVRNLSLSAVPDGVTWALSKNSLFSTKPVYSWLERDISRANNKWI